jgi:hypothetical protein
MTAKFETFKAALHALCVEHGVRLTDGGDYDCRFVSLKLATEDSPAGLETSIEDDIPLTREELEQAERERKERRAKVAAENAEATRRHLEYINSPEYQASLARVTEEGKRTREQQMRVSTDPQDAAYDPRPRRVWRNDVEVTGWTVADEFRRVVIVDGQPQFGSIRIERLESGEGGNPLQATPTAPVNTGFVGVMVHTPDPKPEAPAGAPVEAAAPVVAEPAVPSFGYGKKRR